MQRQREFYATRAERIRQEQLLERERELQRRAAHQEWLDSLPPERRRQVQQHNNFQLMQPVPLLNTPLPQDFNAPTLQPLPVLLNFTASVALQRESFTRQAEVEQSSASASGTTVAVQPAVINNSGQLDNINRILARGRESRRHHVEEEDILNVLASDA